ncbi:MAG TPA: class I tRNA ligase family protein, partial [Candidatus Paceibacterota bacterium]
EKWGERFEQYDLRGAVGVVWELIHWLDEYIEKERPWETKNEKTLYVLCVGLANVSWLLKPFLPQTAEKINGALGIAGKERWEFAPRKIETLFPRIDV